MVADEWTTMVGARRLTGARSEQRHADAARCGAATGGWPCIAIPLNERRDSATTATGLPIAGPSVYSLGHTSYLGVCVRACSVAICANVRRPSEGPIKRTQHGVGHRSGEQTIRAG